MYIVSMLTDKCSCLHDVIYSHFSELLNRVTRRDVESIIANVKQLFRIASGKQVNVDFIHIDYPERQMLTVSNNSTFCFPIVYVVKRAYDLNDGHGPMINHAMFFNMYEALDYMFDVPGVQGIRKPWFQQSVGDYKIDITIIHESAMSAHTVKDVAAALERANAELKRAVAVYMERKRFCDSHGVETSLVEPKLQNYIDDTRRDFIPEN